MKVLIADKLPVLVTQELESLGADVRVEPSIDSASLPGAVGAANVLVVRSTVVSREALARGRELMLVIRAGAGTNTIDVGEASRRGIYVSNCPGRNATAVAELTMGLILAIDRRIPDNVHALRDHQWRKKDFGKADGLLGKTIGVVGLGQIGREVLSRARAFGLTPIACEQFPAAIAASGLDRSAVVSIDELCERADIITLHLPLTAGTRGLIGRAQLDRMKPGTIIINTARGGLIDRAALLDVIDEKGIRVGLDVYDDEPEASAETISDPIVDHPRVYGTHHIGASTEQAQTAVGEEVVRIVRQFMNTGDVPNCVNLAKETPARWQLVVQHVDRVGVLANVLEVLKRNEINAQEITNTVFAGAEAASCKILLDSRPGDDVLTEIRGHEDQIFGVQLIPLKASAPAST